MSASSDVTEGCVAEAVTAAVERIFGASQRREREEVLERSVL